MQKLVDYLYKYMIQLSCINIWYGVTNLHLCVNIGSVAATLIEYHKTHVSTERTQLWK